MSDGSQSARPRREVWAKRVLVGICVVVVLIGAGFLGAAFLPRWWSHRVGDQVNGSIGGGVALGLFYGFVFAALPILVLSWAFGRRRPWKTWGILVLVAIVLALPNLLTLGIVLGSGHAAHAGERTLDVQAPAFRSASLAGAILALIAFVLLYYLLASHRRTRDELERLRAQVKAQSQPPAQAKAQSQSPPGASPAAR